MVYSHRTNRYEETRLLNPKYCINILQPFVYQPNPSWGNILQRVVSVCLSVCCSDCHVGRLGQLGTPHISLLKPRRPHQSAGIGIDCLWKVRKHFPKDGKGLPFIRLLVLLVLLVLLWLLLSLLLHFSILFIDWKEEVLVRIGIPCCIHHRWLLINEYVASRTFAELFKSENPWDSTFKSHQHFARHQSDFVCCHRIF